MHNKSPFAPNEGVPTTLLALAPARASLLKGRRRSPLRRPRALLLAAPRSRPPNIRRRAHTRKDAEMSRKTPSSAGWRAGLPTPRQRCAPQAIARRHAYPRRTPSAPRERRRRLPSPSARPRTRHIDAAGRSQGRSTPKPRPGAPRAKTSEKRRRKGWPACAV